MMIFAGHSLGYFLREIFHKWCDLKRRQGFPAVPKTIAAFPARAVLKGFQTLQLVDNTFLLQAVTTT